jgi:hypothetical protein
MHYWEVWVIEPEMPALDLSQITDFVNEHIDQFHQARILSMQSLNLNRVLIRKNPYLFRAKNIDSASELVKSLLEAHISSSEETTFGQFLELLATYVCQAVYNGQKSTAPGIDLEFLNHDVRYLVAIKSSPNWGNSSQHKALNVYFQNALRVLRQSSLVKHVQPVLGIAYGRQKDADRGIYIQKCGQSFWTFISGMPELYVDIIQPLGFRAQERNEAFEAEKEATLNRFVRDFTIQYCSPSGYIDWAKLVRFNSSNL